MTENGMEDQRLARYFDKRSTMRYYLKSYASESRTFVFLLSEKEGMEDGEAKEGEEGEIEVEEVSRAIFCWMRLNPI